MKTTKKTGLMQIGLCLVFSASISLAQNQNTAVTQTQSAQPTNKPTQGGADKEKMAQERKANQEMMLKISKLNQEVQEAEKKGEGSKPEIVAKKAELKKLQDERNAKMKAEREKMMKEQQASATPESQEEARKIAQLNKEIQDATKNGDGEKPEIVAKKAELKVLQEKRMEKMRAERAKLMQDQGKQAAPSNPEEMKKMSQLNMEIQEATKNGKGDSPEIQAKKAELKKLQEARVAAVKAANEKRNAEQPKAVEEKNQEKKEGK